MNLSDLTATGDSSVIPGETISPPRLIELAEAELEAARCYLLAINHAARDLSESMQIAMHQRAADNLQTSPFSYGMMRFACWALSARGTQYLAWLSLRITRPAITLSRAVELLVQYPQAAGAALDAWGIKKKPALSQAIPSTGTVSSRA